MSMNLQISNGTTSLYDGTVTEDQYVKLATAGKILNNNIIIQTSSGDDVYVIVKYNNENIYETSIGTGKLVLNTAGKYCVYDIYVSLEAAPVDWIDPILTDGSLLIQQAYSITQDGTTLEIE